MRWMTQERLRAIGRLRCPRCYEGQTFRGLLAMHERCPNCNLLYNREQGFFLGALYISYGAGIPILLASMFISAKALDRPLMDSFWPALLIFTPVTPSIFRYSRVLWMHVIQHLDPLKQ